MPSDFQIKLTQVVENLLERLGVAGEITISETDRGFRADIATNDSSLLIGWRGGSLIALEHLARLLVYRSYADETGLPEVQIDIEGYRQRQIDELARTAKKTADIVRQTNAPKILRPMNSYERRIIHSALAEETGVETESIGADPNRRIMIKPRG